MSEKDICGIALICILPLAIVCMILVGGAIVHFNTWVSKKIQQIMRGQQ
jgi:hypothetical protein